MNKIIKNAFTLKIIKIYNKKKAKLLTAELMTGTFVPWYTKK